MGMGDVEDIEQVGVSNEPYKVTAWILAQTGFLEPVEDVPDIGNGAGSRVRQLAAMLGLDVWRVVHRPRVMVRGQPDAKAVLVGVLYAGDEVIVMGERQGDWLQLSDANQLPDEPDEAWVLSKG